MLAALAAAVLLALPAPAADETRLPILLDAYLDHRFAAAADTAVAQKDTADLMKQLAAARVDFATLETALRRGRASYPKPLVAPGRVAEGLALACDHVDYDTTYCLYLPKAYDPAKAWPVVLVGHGGNAQMDQGRAERTARDYIEAFVPEAEAQGYILAAPATARGWGWIGNSILFSAISKLSRDYHVDPDRVYVSGHSMGGHLSWRSGIYYADRFGAVGPMSGGYDYVANRLVFNLFNVPGYATHGTDEPYQIADFNRKIRAWMTDHKFDWVIQEKAGGHEIYADEMPKLFRFFTAHPRDLYRKLVYVQLAGPLRIDTSEPRKEGWSEHHWRKERPILGDTTHWVRATPRAGAKEAGQALVTCRAGNQIEIVASNLASVRLYLHRKLVDLARPIELTVNGVKSKVTAKPDLKLALELVREFDDRGRIFEAALDVTIAGDRPVPEPRN